MSIIRDITIKAERYFESDDILLFVGTRQAGKTTILKQLKNKLEANGNVCYFLNLEDPEFKDLLNDSPKNIFKIFNLDLTGKIFIFIDEIQYLDNPTNFLKYLYDEYKGKIKLLVSGSSSFYIDKKFKDSLAGRKKIFNVRTLSFREFLRFKNEEKLSQTDFGKAGLAEKDKISSYYLQYIVYGGYPRVVLSPDEEKKEILKEIAYSYIKKDIYESGIRQEEVFYKLFKILASQAGGLVNASELAFTLDVSKTSIDNYLYVMRKSFHICFVNPFFKNMRKELTKMPKVYFYDLGLRNFFSGGFQSFEQRNDKGAMLESAVFRQLIEKYDIDEIKFWRTIQQNEVDFILNGKKALEVKVNPKMFKKSGYKIFIENYPNIDLSIASLNTKDEILNNFKIFEAWQI